MSRNFDILHREVSEPAKFQVPIRPEATPGPAPAERTSSNGSAVEDEIIKLVQRVFIFPDAERPPAAVAFCGVDEGAGCSWICTHAGKMLARQAAARICVIDGNYRSPSLHEKFRVEKGIGFAEAMRCSMPICDFVRATRIANLWVMTCGMVEKFGKIAPEPGRLRSRLAELRHEFDYLLIDTPTINPHADAVPIAQLVDGIILVVGSNSTRREPARMARERLDAARVPVLGAVLNRRTYPIPEALYRIL
ncbi:MAG TPA: CpsD/CapB family tyrosine-protein kinase [Candidatus Acidoferrales bacterium]